MRRSCCIKRRELLPREVQVMQTAEFLQGRHQVRRTNASWYTLRLCQHRQLTVQLYLMPLDGGAIVGVHHASILLLQMEDGREKKTNRRKQASHSDLLTQLQIAKVCTSIQMLSKTRSEREHLCSVELDIILQA